MANEQDQNIEVVTDLEEEVLEQPDSIEAVSEEEVEETEAVNQEQPAEDLLDKLKRTMAEFDNFRKRTEKEKATMYEYGAKNILEKVLPIVDNFERALNGVQAEEKESGFVQGIEMIYKQFIAVLKEVGVEPIKAVGETFDPNFHNAVMHTEDENFGENTIAEEFQKGYLYKETVLRHSMVKVVN